MEVLAAERVAIVTPTLVAKVAPMAQMAAKILQLIVIFLEVPVKALPLMLSVALLVAYMALVVAVEAALVEPHNVAAVVLVAPLAADVALVWQMLSKQWRHMATMLKLTLALVVAEHWLGTLMLRVLLAALALPALLLFVIRGKKYVSI